MPITVNCGCGQTLQAKDSLAGKQVKCPKCGGVLLIPGAPAPAQMQGAGLDPSWPAQSPTAPLGNPGMGPAMQQAPMQQSPYGQMPMQQAPLGNTPPMMGSMQSPYGAASPGWQTQSPTQKKKGSNRGLLIGLICGGVFLFVAAGVAVVLVVVLSGGDDKEVANKSNSSDKVASNSGSDTSYNSNSPDTMYESSPSSRSRGGSASGAGSQRHEQLSDELIGEFESLVSTLESVYDKDSAATAAPEIDRIRQRVPAIVREAKALPALSRSDNMRLETRVKSRLTTLQSRMQSAMFQAARKSQGERNFARAIQRLGTEWRTLQYY